MVNASRIRRVLGKVVIAVLGAALWFVFLAPASLGGPVSLIWVSGTSMQPTLYTGDLSIMYQRGSYDPGDLVAFELPEGGTVIHRVVRETSEGYEFRGDNRNHDDPWTLEGHAIRGRQLFHVPKAAEVMTFLGQPALLGVLTAIVVLLGLLRQENQDAPTLGPGYLNWGVVGKSPGRLVPSVQRRRRTRRARRHLVDYRRDLVEFQQWPERTPI